MAAPTAPFRFVHTADLHLDSPLKSLALRDAALAERIDGATRTALRRTVDLCIEERVDALLIAGDLYDGDQKSMHTAAALTAEMRRLGDAGIPVFLIRGNHDAESRVTKELMLPENVHAFDGRGGVRELADGAVAIHGVSFLGRAAPDSLLPRLKPPRPDALNIGLLHTSLTGGEGRHATYAPCTLGELLDHGYQYWALGHVHKRQVHSGWPAVVMPGNPQGRDIGEDGPRSVSLVTLDADGAHVEERDVSSACFERGEGRARRRVRLGGGAGRARAHAARGTLGLRLGEPDHASRARRAQLARLAPDARRGLPARHGAGARGGSRRRLGREALDADRLGGGGR